MLGMKEPVYIRTPSCVCRSPWVELSSVLQVRPRWAGLVDVWLINPLNVPFTITHASLPQDTQGVLKVPKPEAP